ncbi:MAG: hypothetical protein H6704_06515 [Myxococcales bacterium]|nr:hypothetical protein [Myxococcales bacterium]
MRLVAPAKAPPVDTSAPLIGLDTAPIVRRVLDELGLVHTVRTRLEGPPRPITVALPDRRFTLEPTVEARGRALAEAFPDEVPALLTLFDRLEGYAAPLDAALDGTLEWPPDGFGARRALRKALAGLPTRQLIEAPPAWSDAGPLRGLVAALLALAGRVDDADGPMTPGGARALWHLCHGAAAVQGGQVGLIDVVVAKLATFGGAVGARPAAARVEGSRRRVEAVITEDGARYGARAVVLADGAEALAPVAGELLGEAPAVPGGAARVAVGPADRPPGLADPCAWLPAEGASAVRVRVDAGGLDLAWRGAQPPDLEALLPFAEARVDATTNAPWAAPAPDLDPLGLARAPLRGPPKNLLRAGDLVLPGLGLEGTFLSAWLAADAAARACPKRRAG